MLLKFVDLILPGHTVDIVNIPEAPFDQCWRCGEWLRILTIPCRYLQ